MRYAWNAARRVFVRVKYCVYNKCCSCINKEPGMREREGERAESLFWQPSIQLKRWTTRYCIIRFRLCEHSNEKELNEDEILSVGAKEKMGLIVWIVTINFISSKFGGRCMNFIYLLLTMNYFCCCYWCTSTFIVMYLARWRSVLSQL